MRGLRAGGLAVLLILGACGGGDDDGEAGGEAAVDDPATEPSDGGTGDGTGGTDATDDDASPGEIERTAVSDDGALRVTVPDSSDVSPTIAPAAVPTDLPDDVSAWAYELGPDGATFDDPVVIELTMPAPTATVGVFGLLTGSDGRSESLLLELAAVNGSEVTITTTVDHFSSLRIWTFPDVADAGVTVNTSDGVIGQTAASTTWSPLGRSIDEISLGDTAFLTDSSGAVSELPVDGETLTVDCALDGEHSVTRWAWLERIFDIGADDAFLLALGVPLEIERDARASMLTWGSYDCSLSPGSIALPEHLVFEQGLGERLEFAGPGDVVGRTEADDSTYGVARWFADDGLRAMTVTVPTADGSVTTVRINLVGIGQTTEDGYLEVVGGINATLDPDGLVGTEAFIMPFRDGTEIDAPEFEVSASVTARDGGLIDLTLGWEADPFDEAIAAARGDAELAQFSAIVNHTIDQLDPVGVGTRDLPDGSDETLEPARLRILRHQITF